MSNEWWDETSAEFAANFVLASTGLHRTHKPEVSIEPVEQGVYRLSVDKESIALTAQDLLDIGELVLLHARELEAEAKAAVRAEMQAKGWPVDEQPQDRQSRRDYRDDWHVMGGEL